MGVRGLWASRATPKRRPSLINRTLPCVLVSDRLNPRPRDRCPHICLQRRTADIISLERSTRVVPAVLHPSPANPTVSSSSTRPNPLDPAWPGLALLGLGAKSLTGVQVLGRMRGAERRICGSYRCLNPLEKNAGSIPRLTPAPHVWRHCHRRNMLPWPL